MKIFTRLVLFAMAVAVTPATVFAQEFPVTAQLTLRQQDESSFSESKGVYTDKIKTTRLTSNYLLTLLQPFHTGSFPNGFPSGARLMLVNFSHFQVQSAGGDVLVADTGPYLTYSDTYSQTNVLFQGKESIENGSLKHMYFYQSTIEFHDPSPDGTSFTFIGHAIEKYSRSAEDFRGDQFSQGSLRITGIGSGNIGGSFFLLSGKISTPTMKWIE
jgi:hypothetical protein